jgi:predicted nucleic-acid-binding Zn-ribbon protein
MSDKEQVSSFNIECPHCGALFLRKGSLTSHLKNHCKLIQVNCNHDYHIAFTKVRCKLCGYIQNADEIPTIASPGKERILVYKEECERLKRLDENVKEKMAYLKDLESRNDLTEYSYAQLKLLESLDK